MNWKKNTTIIIIILVIAIAVIIASTFYPPSKNADSTGTIGVVKKYNAGQMSQKDVKLKNVMLKDTATIRHSVEHLKNYKAFITGLAVDLGKWNETIENAKKKSTKGIKDEKILTEKAASFIDYKKYIEKNINVVDNTIDLFTKISKSDTLNINLSIENTITEYENFRIQVAQKFETMLSNIPVVHNAFVKNGIKGIIGNTEGTIGMIVINNSFTMGSTDYQSVMVGNKVTFAVIYTGKIQGMKGDHIAGKIDLTAAAKGNAILGTFAACSKPGLDCYLLSNTTADYKLVQVSILNNATEGKFSLGGNFRCKPDYNSITGNRIDLGLIMSGKPRL